jgi:hypothetical protein
MISAEQYRQVVILQIREMSIFAGPADRKAVSDLLDALEAASPGDDLIMKVGSFLLEYTGSVVQGKEVSPAKTLHSIVEAVS